MAATPPPQTGVSVERFRVPEGMLLRLSGVIDERFPTDVYAGASGIVAVDLGGITRITSFGIRAWRQAIATVPGLAGLYFVAVPACVMAQFGMVLGFGGPKGQILSFSAPYRCGACNAEKNRLFDRRNDSSLTTQDPPTETCTACGGTMEFDELPDLYREALAGTAPLAVVPALLAVLAAADAAARGLKVAKAVADAATLLWLSGSLDGRANFRHVADGLEGEVVLVVDEVTACDVAGLQALAKLVSAAASQGCRVWVARPTPALTGALARHPGALDPAQVVPRDAEPRLMPSWMPPLLERPPQGTPSSFRGPFLERYSLVRFLGSGGMAEIYLARQIGPAGFDRPVAVKRILPNLAREQAFIQMFLSEARLAARIAHPNVVQIHELLEADGQYYIVMEFVEGSDLSTLLGAVRQQQKQVPLEHALAITASVCAGLHAAHTTKGEGGRAYGIVHRDVSPQNVLVGIDGRVKLTDFGVARAADRLDQTKPGVIKGKISYLSPEALSGLEIDHRSDVFAAGVLLFEILAGYHPFKRGSDYQTYQAILNHPLPPMSAARPDVPTDLDALLGRATARDREQRYQTAEELQIDLEHLAAKLGRPASAPALARWVQAVRNAVPAAAGDAITAVVATLPGKPVS